MQLLSLCKGFTFIPLFFSHDFSPFELVFGHAVRGPLLLLKEKWLDEDPEKISVLKYVATFKDRLFRAGVPKQNESMV